MNKIASHFLTGIAFGLILISCNPAEKAKSEETAVVEQRKDDTQPAPDSTELTELTRKLYQWHETHDSNDDFNPTTGEAQDSLYIGLDWNSHTKRMAELKKTNFFSKDFLTNYNNIAQTIDKGLKDGSMEWLVGDLPPYGNDANAWCNCQDNPEKYWEKLTISNIHQENGLVSFNWTWGGDFQYQAKAQKEDGAWKISYLEGFDPKNYIAIE